MVNSWRFFDDAHSCAVACKLQRKRRPGKTAANSNRGRFGRIHGSSTKLLRRTKRG
jgi:hypothetical protein